MASYVLITGATSGIGYALAEEFAKNKNSLIIASRNCKKMEVIKNDFLKKFQCKVIPFEIDLAQADSAEKLFEFCQNNKYQVDVLINNAGIGLGPVPQVDHSLPETLQLLNLNVVTLVKLCTLFGHELKKRKHGYILNIASTAAFQPMPYAALYGASKAFVLSLSEAMAAELHEHGVGVTAVCPGITDTNFFKHGKPNVPAWLYKLISPELVAQRAIKAMYQKKISLIPYFQHWLIAQISRFLPRHAALGIMKNVEVHRKRIN